MSDLGEEIRRLSLIAAESDRINRLAAERQRQIEQEAGLHMTEAMIAVNQFLIESLAIGG